MKTNFKLFYVIFKSQKIKNYEIVELFAVYNTVYFTDISV